MIIGKKKCPVCGKNYDIHCLEIPSFGCPAWLWHKKLNTCPICGYVKYTRENGDVVEDIPKNFPGRARI